MSENNPSGKKITLGAMLPKETVQKVARKMLKNVVMTDAGMIAGYKYDGKDIYVGRYKPKGRDDKSLRKTFNVFAAPRDLRGKKGKGIMLTFGDALQQIAEMNGPQGRIYKTDQELFDALKDGSYAGEWIIPPRELLTGRDKHAKKVQRENLMTLRDKGDFKGTFTENGEGAWYWSLTKFPHAKDAVDVLCIADGWQRICFKDDKTRLSCRPVRLVRVKTP